MTINTHTLKRRRLLYITLFLGLVSLGWLYRSHIALLSSDSYQYVQQGDKDDMHERLILLEEVKGEQALHAVLIDILTQSPQDMLAQQAAVRYIREHHQVGYLNEVQELLSHYESLDPDTSWVTRVSDGRARMNGIKNSALMSDLRWTITELTAP